MKLQIVGVAIGVALLAGQVRAGVLETINFDTLADGVTPIGNLVSITNQYPNVTFSAGGGDVVLTTCQNNAACPSLGGLGGSPPYLGSFPNLICTGTAGGTVDCTHDITLTFSALVDNLTFTAFGNQTTAPGQFALADVYINGILTAPNTNIPLNVSHTVHCAANTFDCAGDPQALNFTGISMVIIHGNTDHDVNGLTNGSAYDDFAFTVEAPGIAPEPSTLLLTGLCGIVWAGRRLLRKPL